MNSNFALIATQNPNKEQIIIKEIVELYLKWQEINKDDIHVHV